MNFSLFNKKIEYSFTWGRPLKVLGEGKVCERDLDVKYDQGKGRRWTEEYVGVEFDKGITGVEAGFLEGFPNLKYVVIPYTLRSIEVTPKLKAMLQQKNVLVRGWYDSYGERFARENGLAFRHADIVVGWTRDEEHDTSTRLEIRFNEKGCRRLRHSVGCAGRYPGTNNSPFPAGTWRASKSTKSISTPTATESPNTKSPSATSPHTTTRAYFPLYLPANRMAPVLLSVIR